MKYLIIALLIAVPVSAECRMVCDGGGSTNSAFSDEAPPGFYGDSQRKLIESITERNKAETENLYERQLLNQIYGQKAASSPNEAFPGMNWAIQKSIAESLRGK